MKRTLRSCELLPCSEGHSLFRLIDRLWLDPSTRQTLHRICTMMRLMGVKMAVLEELTPVPNVDNGFISEMVAIRKRLKRNKVEVSFRKVTFVAEEGSRSDIIRFPDSAFLGYVVICDIGPAERPLRTYVYESVIREVDVSVPEDGSEGRQRLGWMSYLHGKKVFRCQVFGGQKEYQVSGCFFCQQNTITSVCAHACTAMMINNTPGISRFIGCEDINRLLGIDHVRRMQDVPDGIGDNLRATHEGLFNREIFRVLREYEMRPYLQLFDGANRRFYRGFLYGFVESGFPSLLTFTNIDAVSDQASHVVAVVGHSLNRHSWLPTAYSAYGKAGGINHAYLSSLNWVNDFIVHDDNFGMQLSLPAHSFAPEELPNPNSALWPDLAIGAFPERAKVEIPGHIVEPIAWEKLSEIFTLADDEQKAAIGSNYYVSHLMPHLSGAHAASQTAVLRTLLLPTQSYLGQLEKRGMRPGYTENDLSVVRDSLQHLEWVWIVEVTEPDLYVANQAKVLDVIVDPTVSAAALFSGNKTTQAVIGVRLPNCWITVRDVVDGKSAIETTPLAGVEGHLPMARTEIFNDV